MRNEDAAVTQIRILPGNERLMKSLVMAVQSTAGLRKTALFQGWGVYLSPAGFGGGS